MHLISETARGVVKDPTSKLVELLRGSIVSSSENTIDAVNTMTYSPTRIIESKRGMVTVPKAIWKP